VAKADSDEPQVRVEEQFSEMFDGRDVVSAAEFELLLRRRLKKEGDEAYAAVRAERRTQQLLELLDELWGAGLTAADQNRIRKQVEEGWTGLWELRRRSAYFTTGSTM
jgi:molecular chaperone GrpE (heat shock protein)